MRSALAAMGVAVDVFPHDCPSSIGLPSQGGKIILFMTG
jgi:hypothetical protein